MTGITHLVLLPQLMNRLSEVAPSVRVEVTRISARTPKMLESGDADLAVGFMPELEAGFYQQKLFDQRVAETLLRITEVKVFRPPFTLPGFAIKQHWHERYQQDPSNKWLRSVIADLFLER
jgi:hypothetical protein